MRAEAPAAAAEILLLTDKDDTVSLMRSAAQTNNVSLVRGCPEVLSFLRRQGNFKDSPRPDLIILDLDLANPEQCDTLRDLKRDPELGRIPVVVIAANGSQDAVLDAYNLYANAFVIKPLEWEEFLRVIKATLSFWLRVARLPRG